MISSSETTFVLNYSSFACLLGDLLGAFFTSSFPDTDSSVTSEMINLPNLKPIYEKRKVGRQLAFLEFQWFYFWNRTVLSCSIVKCLLWKGFVMKNSHLTYILISAEN